MRSARSSVAAACPESPPAAWVWACATSAVEAAPRWNCRGGVAGCSGGAGVACAAPGAAVPGAGWAVPAGARRARCRRAKGRWRVSVQRAGGRGERPRAQQAVARTCRADHSRSRGAPWRRRSSARGAAATASARSLSDGAAWLAGAAGGVREAAAGLARQLPCRRAPRPRRGPRRSRAAHAGRSAYSICTSLSDSGIGRVPGARARGLP